MAGPGNILIKIGADAGQAVRELGGLNRSLDDTASTGQKMHAGLQKAALPAAAALAAIGYAAVDAAKAAAQDADAQVKLAGVLERTTGATDAQIASTEDWISATARATGVSDDQLRPSLAKLATATHDVGLAQDALTVALDVSAATGKDVETVSAAIAKAYGGQTGALKKLIPGMDAATLKGGDMNAIMQMLADTTGGAMADHAATAAGQYQILTDQMSELKETLGASLLPVIESLLPMLLAFADFAAKNTTAIKILIATVAIFAAGILAANAVLKLYAAAQLAVKIATVAWTAAQWLLNAALSGNPIGIVIIAVAALAAGIIFAYKHSETFRAIVSAAFDAAASAARALGAAFKSVLAAASSAFDWIMGHWKLIAPLFGPIGIAIVLVVNHFDALKAAASACFDAISSAISGIASVIESVINAVERLIGALGRIHVPKINLPHIPGLNALEAASSPLAARAAGPGASGQAVTVNVYGAIDPEGTARTILRVLNAHERRQGRRYYDVWPSSITIDGVEVLLGDVLAELTIRHGRTGAYDSVNASTAQLTLLDATRSQTAGFHVGVPLVVLAEELGLEAPRFVGTVTDASLDDDRLTVIAAGPLSTLSRYRIGAEPWPSERWSDRVTRAFAEAGVPELLVLQYDPGFNPTLVARGDLEQPPSEVDLLSYLGTLADDVAAAIVDTPDGHVLVQQLTYRTTSGSLTWATAPGTWADVDPAVTWADASSLGEGPLPVLVVDPADVTYVPTWEQALAVENETTIGFGDQQAVTVTEPASVARFGEFPGGVSTQLATLDDATQRATERVSRLAFPRWVITQAPLLRGVELHVGQVIALSGFPPSSPHATWRPLLEGWQDVIRGDSWNVELALSDSQLSGVSLMWVDVPADLAWADVPPSTAWSDASTLDALVPVSRKELSHA